MTKPVAATRRLAGLAALAIFTPLSLAPQSARAIAIDRTYELVGGTVAKYNDSVGALFDSFLTPAVIDPDIKGELTLHRVQVIAPSTNVSSQTLFDFELYFRDRPLVSGFGRPPGQRIGVAGGEFPDPAVPPPGHRYLLPAQLRWVHGFNATGDALYTLDANFLAEDFEIGPGGTSNKLKAAKSGPVDTNASGLGLHVQMIGWTGLTGARVNVDKIVVQLVGELDNYQIFSNPNADAIEIAADDTAYNAEHFLNTGSIAVAGSFENRAGAGAAKLDNEGSISVLAGGEFDNPGTLEMSGWLDVASNGVLRNQGTIELDGATADLQIASGASFVNDGTLQLSAEGASATVRGALTNLFNISNLDGKLVFAPGSTVSFGGRGWMFNYGTLENRTSLVLDGGSFIENKGTAFNYAGARIEVNSALGNSGGGAFGNNGALVVEAGGELANGAESVLLNQDLLSTRPGSKISNLGRLTNDDLAFIRGDFFQSSTGSLVNSAGATLTFDALGGLAGPAPDLGASGVIDNLGLMTLEGGARLQTIAFFDNQGRLLIGAGSRLDNLGLFMNRGLLEVAGLFDNAFGELTQSSAGSIKLANGTLRGGALVLEGGSLSGNGKIEGDLTLMAGGTAAPGNSPGRIDIDGDLIVDGGELVIESAGRAGQDVLAVTGDVRFLGGSVNFIALPGYTPDFDDSWDWLRHGGELSTDDERFAVTYSGLPDGWTARTSVRADGRSSVYLLPQWASPLEHQLSGGGFLWTYLDHGTQFTNTGHLDFVGALSIREDAVFLNEGVLNSYSGDNFIVNRGKLLQSPGASFHSSGRFRNVAGASVEGGAETSIYNYGDFEVEADSSVTTGYFGHESWALDASTRVDGTLTTQTLQILGGRLGGHGTLAIDAEPVDLMQLADVARVQDALVQPGGSIGTLRIDGSLSLLAATVEIEIGSLTDFDRLEVTGDLVFQPSRIDYLFVDGFLPAGGRIEWLRVDGGLYGYYDPVSFFWTVGADGTRTAYAPSSAFGTSVTFDGSYVMALELGAAPVPLPPAAGLLAAGLALIWRRRRR